jgi:hypothetical protein
VPILASPGETVEQELARLRECRRLLAAAYARGGHITRATVAAILTATAPPNPER